MDFSNIHLEKDKATNYYNATQLVKFSHKKNLKKWVKFQMTKDSFLGMIDPKHNNWSKFSYKSGSDLFVDKQLILDLAAWISPEYYIKVWTMVGGG